MTQSLPAVVLSTIVTQDASQTLDLMLTHPQIHSSNGNGHERYFPCDEFVQESMFYFTLPPLLLNSFFLCGSSSY